MGIRCYLAMTDQEISGCEQMPEHPGWMACHFSCYGTGLSNLPRNLPAGSMVILNDRTPIQGHDPKKITQQLCALCETHKPECVLLDLQRAGEPQLQKLANTLTEQLPCPVGVSEAYAGDCGGAVFVSPCPLCTPLKKHLAPWEGREVWLDVALQAQVITVDRDGCHPADVPLSQLPEPIFTDEELCCRYHMELLEDRVLFHLRRSKDELSKLLQQADALGVTYAVGLFQQLADFHLDFMCFHT